MTRSIKLIVNLPRTSSIHAGRLRAGVNTAMASFAAVPVSEVDCAGSQKNETLRHPAV